MHPGTYVFFTSISSISVYLLELLIELCATGNSLRRLLSTLRDPLQICLSVRFLFGVCDRSWNWHRTSSLLTLKAIEDYAKSTSRMVFHSVATCGFSNSINFHLNLVKRYFNFNWNGFSVFVCKALYLLRKSMLFAPLSQKTVFCIKSLSASSWPAVGNLLNILQSYWNINFKTHLF